MDLLSLSENLNQKIKCLQGQFDQSTFDRSELIKEVWILVLSEIEKETFNNILWIGFSEDSFQLHLKMILNPKEGSALHEKYKTDSNLYVGNIKHVSSSNSWVQSPKNHFFIDSWYGSMSGEMSPLKILENSFFAKKSA